MSDVVFEGEVEAGTNKFTAMSTPLRLAQATDGPFMARDLWRSIEEVAQALVAAPLERRQPIELALEFFEQGVRGDDSFFNYWTALEILCNGSSQTIKTKIQKCYSLKSIGDVDRITGMRTLAKWRHDFFHKGKRPQFVGEEARYTQMLFLDLLRQELQLPFGGYLAAIQTTPGYNLSGLGLADNRTPQQLEAIRRAQQQLMPSEALRSETP